MKRFTRLSRLSRLFAGFLPLTISAVMLTGCGGGSSSVPTEIVIPAATAESENPEFPLKLADGTMIDHAPESAASLSPAATEIIAELGCSDRLTAVCRYCDYPEGLTAQTAGSSENPDIEKLTELHPEVLFTTSPLAEREIYALQTAGITIVELSAPKTVEDYGAMYATIAEVFGGSEAGKAAQDSAVDALKTAAAGVSLGTFIYVTPKLTAAGSDTFEGAVLSLCGENLCAAAGYIESAEDISGAPEYIIAADSLAESDITGSELFGGLVSDETKIIFVPAQRFERPSGRLTEIFSYIGETE